MVHWFLSSFVSATLQALIEKFANLGIIVYKSLMDVDDKLKRLERTLFRVQAMLHDAEDKQRSDKAWQIMVRDLEGLAYDADDLLDEIAIRVAELDSGHQNYKDQVCMLLLSLFKSTSAPNISSIQDKLDGILNEMDSVCLRDIVQGRHLSLLESNQQCSSLSDEPHAFGRGTDRRKIINLLPPLEGSMGNSFSVIPIVGMVGVGKTTLAQLVYNYEYRRDEAFALKMWVSVTKNFDVGVLTRSVVEAATGQTPVLSSLDQLQLKLLEILQGKKFMLVLDDVWNIKRKEWDLLLKPFRVGSSGSAIIVTTRSHAVSMMVATAECYTLKSLSDQDCWSLLKAKALGNADHSGVPNIVEIGKGIAKKCKGLPLAAKSLGIMLQSKLDEGEWNNILKSKIWEIPELQNEIVPALNLSYRNLPSHLKQCFAYCSMFPENHNFEKDILVQMWMAEGFIQAEGKRTMEDIGSDYFHQLLSISFFQEEDDKYKMHDAVHSFAQSVSGDNFFRMEKTDDLHISSLNRNTRHSTLLCENIQTKTFEAFYNCKGLHTFRMSGERGMPVKEVPLALFQKLGRLRVLDLSNSRIEELTWSIGNLRHLRYLDLSKTLLKCLPETMHELCSLQTLRLYNCSMLLCLPSAIVQLTTLRHLELGGTNQLTSMPSGIGKLTSLQTLSQFIIGEDSGQIEELRDMNMFRGTLCIKQLEKVNNPQEAVDAKLDHKTHLDRLELHWSSAVYGQTVEHVVNNLQPHGDLTELTLRRYGGLMFPTWIASPLFAKLRSISLFECEKCVIFPCLGQLPKLKSLKVVGMHNLEEVDSKFFGASEGIAFRSLEKLELRDMNKLTSWSGVLHLSLLSLLELTIIKCPLLTIIPSLHCLNSMKKLQLENCPQLQHFTDVRLSSSIQSMLIAGCPLLTDRCSRGRGVDWLNIAHIPFIEIDGKNA